MLRPLCRRLQLFSGRYPIPALRLPTVPRICGRSLLHPGFIRLHAGSLREDAVDTTFKAVLCTDTRLSPHQISACCSVIFIDALQRKEKKKLHLRRSGPRRTHLHQEAAPNRAQNDQKRASARNESRAGSIGRTSADRSPPSVAGASQTGRLPAHPAAAWSHSYPSEGC